MGCVCCCIVPLLAQTSTQSTERTSITIGEEHHHHLEFENSYVRVYFVEIPAHESTLFHRHDFPYLSVPPTGPDAEVPPPPGAASQQGTGLPRIAYSPGNFSHTVTNSADFPLRNVAIELLRPQGNVWNLCGQVIREQPHESCNSLEPSAKLPATDVPLFATDDLLVQAWHISSNATISTWDDRANTLLASLNRVAVTASGGVDSSNALKGGLLWLPAGSKPVFKTAPDSDGHFISITFKDIAAKN